MMQMPQEFSCSTCDAAVPAALELSAWICFRGPKKIKHIHIISHIFHYSHYRFPKWWIFHWENNKNHQQSRVFGRHPTTKIASLGCNSLNFLVGADSSRGGVEDNGVSSTVGAPAAVSCRVWWILISAPAPFSLEKHQTDDQRIQGFNESFPNIAWIVDAMLVGRPCGYGPRDIHSQRIGHAPVMFP